MKGYVPTPAPLVDKLVGKLFAARAPASTDILIDPGCGDGAFIDGVIRFCAGRYAVPRIIGVELNPSLVAAARRRFASLPAPAVQIVHADFLTADLPRADFIVGNPPYVSIVELSDTERKKYRRLFAAASGRFDLYMLFFERSIRLLRDLGRLVFVTPEKFMFVHSAAPLRRQLLDHHVEEIEQISEDTFEGLVTYPTITTFSKRDSGKTRVVQRDGTKSNASLSALGQSWMASIIGTKQTSEDILDETTLGDLCVRVSCGVATGADEVFIQDSASLGTSLRLFARPTISGRQLSLQGYTEGTEVVRTRDSILTPYHESGRLIAPGKLRELAAFLGMDVNREKLLRRSCVRSGRKEWYEFHDSAVLPEILCPKILFKDITKHPRFWIDRGGGIVPRHSVYYAVPKNPFILDSLTRYLNSDKAAEWLRAHCQRAAGGFLRMQSRVLQALPIPRAALQESAPLVAVSKKRKEVLL